MTLLSALEQELPYFVTKIFQFTCSCTGIALQYTIRQFLYMQELPIAVYVENNPVPVKKLPNLNENNPVPVKKLPT